MRFGVLQAGRAPRDARARRGNYGQMYVDFFNGPGQWEIVDVEHGEFPDRATDFDGYVITGSKFSVNDNEPWIHRLLEFIREIHGERIRLAAFCFGHHAAAKALGGLVTPNPAGWEVGVREVHLTNAAKSASSLSEAPDPICIFETHQDAVMELPPGAVHLGSSAHTHHEMFSIGDHILSVQGHPEFDEELIRELVRRMGDMLTPEEARIAIDSLALTPHQDFLHRWLRGFLVGDSGERDSVEKDVQTR